MLEDYRPPPSSSTIEVEVRQKNFQILMMSFSKIREYVTEYSSYRQVVYYLLFPSFYLPQKDKTRQQDKSFTVQTWVTSSNQCLHLFHTYQLLKLHHWLIYGRACPVTIKSSTSLRLFWFFSPVLIFALTCTYCGWISILVYVYIHSVLLPVVVRMSATGGATVK
jgi:hypothetical protein